MKCNVVYDNTVSRYNMFRNSCPREAAGIQGLRVCGQCPLIFGTICRLSLDTPQGSEHIFNMRVSKAL